jgi:hypothetical protein
MIDFYQSGMKSVPIITIIVSSNPAHGEISSIQNYAIQFVSDLRQVCGFLLDTLVSPTNNTDATI